MKVSREDVQEAMKRAWTVWSEDTDAPFEEDTEIIIRILKALDIGIEIEDPEPEVVLEFGEWYRLASDGSVQYRTPSNAWVRCELDENHLAKIAEEVTRLARDIQRKDEALRKIKCFPCSRERTGGFDCGECPACIAHKALGGDP